MGWGLFVSITSITALGVSPRLGVPSCVTSSSLFSNVDILFLRKLSLRELQQRRCVLILQVILIATAS